MAIKYDNNHLLGLINESIRASKDNKEHFEIIDARYDARYYFSTSKEAIAKSEELGMNGFQYHAADGSVLQVQHIGDEWKTAVRTKTMDWDSSQGVAINSIQENIDKKNFREIVARQKNREYLDGDIDKELDKQMAIADVRAYGRIEDKQLNSAAAWNIAVSADLSQNYKAALDNPLLHDRPSLINDIEEKRLNSQVVVEDVLNKDKKNVSVEQANNPVENTISQNSRVRQSDLLEDHEPHQAAISDSTKAQPDRYAMPETVSSRYLKLENKYYMPDKSVAFEDHGNKLKLETENRTVILDALKIAESRGWESINVSGSKNFKHQVWREASIQGMDVTGYKPTALEIAELNHAMLMREERLKEKETRYDTPDNYISPMPEKNTADLRGVLVAYGADHYKHDPSQSQSYFVTLDVGNGREITRWGSDLKRAFAESQSLPQVGDEVVLGNKGKKDIKITATVLDDHGNPVEENKTVQKNLWRIEKASYQETLEEQAEALRVGQEIEDKVIAQMPRLAAALAVSKLGERIAQEAKQSGALKSQDEVDTVVYLIREGLAAALKDGRKIKTLEIREQGQQAAVDANSIINDHKPPEITREPSTQEIVR